MKSIGFKVGIGFFVLSLVYFPCVHSEWSKPVLLSELNDLENQFPAVEPAISSDGLHIFFVRRVPGSGVPMYLFEARRDTIHGVFQTPVCLSELGNNGGFVEKPWISLDKKRLYFAEIRNELGLWHRFIRVSSRESTDQTWGQAVTITEIHEYFNESVDSAPVLIGDELTLFWQSNDNSNITSRKSYSAVRKSLDDPFISIHEVVELNQISAEKLYLSPDGLTVYFTAPNPTSGINNIWKGTRSARDGVFGDFEILSDLCDEVRRASGPYLTPDGKTIFFNSKMGDDLTQNCGIWESHWVEEPLVEARQKLAEALETKRALLDQIDAAVSQEQEAIAILRDLWRHSGYRGSVRANLLVAIGYSSAAVSQELAARRLVNHSIQSLQKALDRLEPKTNPKPSALQKR